MRVKTGFSPALALKAACEGKNAYFRYIKKNVRVKGLSCMIFLQIENMKDCVRIRI